jgi:hypothetical protein
MSSSFEVHYLNQNMAMRISVDAQVAPVGIYFVDVRVTTIDSVLLASTQLNVSKLTRLLVM